MSATDNLGPHLLGRNAPSEYQQRGDANYQMADYLKDSSTDFTALDAALNNVLNQPGAAATTKAFCQAVVNFLKGSPSPAPTPTPTPTPTPSGSKDWPDAQQLDQGQTGHCVGFGGTQYRNAEPQPNTLTNNDGHALYYACKVNDGEPKAENGSTVHSLAQVLKQEGHINTYVWASSTDDIKNWILNNGPVVVGVDWFNNMFNPDANGFVKPTGGIAGGHCFLVVGFYPTGSVTPDGYTVPEDSFRAQNSWGKSWSINGYFYISVKDFAKLLAAQGEAMAAADIDG